jgi:hypothetical protein
LVYLHHISRKTIFRLAAAGEEVPQHFPEFKPIVPMDIYRKIAVSPELHHAVLPSQKVFPISTEKKEVQPNFKVFGLTGQKDQRIPNQHPCGSKSELL